ncbi:hypothetical protein COT97_04975 [Candidatus Falkowbacteria bacterium CG10_big_fil_rev_8_21_14_0_10_39_11]|uniref:Ferrichrome ABC transporter permease n=1 Tax=Candidatus Falkowbacteria bacterium CG10_big_fil_rev_8_21_14_0_10_39_11 TaxID=1974565 RepID=A0A2H0V3W0_9BACT|nr:MAG: hypothetical protein COT97_04975 [Candidatus Falkowbacteria bacterium CG10_big_fil_rev_8_21_14_0_10_39_11]
MIVYAITIFFSSFLVFFIQPLIGKYLLPWFGGSASVWLVSLMFFQVFLFLGYFYSHFLIQQVKILNQIKINIFLLIVAIVSLPTIPGDFWQDKVVQHPTVMLFIVLLFTIGLPFFVVSSASPIIQYLYYYEKREQSPYVLYSVSNAGAIIALISYPILFEVLLNVKQQAVFWAIIFIVFTVFYIFLYVKALKTKHIVTLLVEKFTHTASARQKTFWLGLPIITTLMLITVTNHMTLNVAPIPFLWVLPLCLYLLSYIISFSGLKLYHRGIYFILFLISVGGIFYYLNDQTALTIIWQVFVLLAGLFIICLVGHFELFRLRPHPKQLTEYYLYLAGGGALGGILGAVVLPSIASVMFELPLVVILFTLILYTIFYLDKKNWLNQLRHRPVWLFLLIIPIGFTLFFVKDIQYQIKNTDYMSRNFYGTISVGFGAGDGAVGEYKILVNGPIIHGVQFLSPALQANKTTYYSQQSGVGLVFENFPKANKRIGLVGLGAGTIVAYGQAGDYFRIYDINPEVISVAQSQFTYLQNTPSKYDLVLGDARLKLDQESDNNFDLLIIDAFSGDSIPVHLLTQEAFDVYRKNLNPDGAILIHISNQYLDLRPVLVKLGAVNDYQVVIINNKKNDAQKIYTSNWILLTKNKTLLSNKNIVSAQSDLPTNSDRFRVWTDQYSNIFKIIK